MSKKIAYSGILLALNIILLLLINVIPMNTLFIMGVASLLASIVIMEWGIKQGLVYSMASVMLGFIVMTNKSQWVLYSFTFAIYGVIKYLIEKDRSVALEYIMKLAFANIMLGVIVSILSGVVYIPINLITIVVYQIGFIVYDYVYSSFIDYYNFKIRKILNIN